MKYHLVPSDSGNDLDIKYIYILPSSSEGSSYSIAYPDIKVEDILEGGITIRSFDGCS